MTGTSIQFAVEKITPRRAQQYLELNRKNRRLSQRTVTRYAKMMRSGEWLLNGEAIKFNGGDELLDGQHRLRAVIVSQTPVEMCVIRGLPSDAFKTFDQGKSRTGGDCLYVLDYAHPNALAAAGRILFGYELEWKSVPRHFRSVTNDELLQTLKRHPGLVSAGHAYMRRPLFTPLIPHSIGMFTYYLASRVDKDLAERFFTKLSAVPKTAGRPTEPPLVLRAQLVKTSAEAIRPTSTDKLAWVITAWNSYKAGKPLQRLSRIVESMPRFLPDPVKPRWRTP